MRVQHNLLVIDVETTGLDPSRHACIEIGAVMLDESLRPTQEFSSLVAPWKGAEFIEAAMKVNQISLEQLQHAPVLGDVMKRFHETFGWMRWHHC